MTRSIVSRRDLLRTTAALSLGFAVPRSARAQTSTDVIVIGAGLSGLNAVLILEEQGLDVIVLEGRKRIGGRLMTLDHPPGIPEAGGNGMAGGKRSIGRRLRSILGA